MPEQPDLIYLIAPSGHPNFGDEYIVSSWLHEFKLRRPNARVVLDCHSPGIAAILHHRMHPNLTVTDTLWTVAQRAEDPAAASHAVLDPGREPRMVSGINLANQATIVHLLGGGWINDQWPHHTKVVAAAATAGALGVRKFATGQGLTPGDAIREELEQWWQAFELIGVRDEPSARVLPVPSTDPAGRAVPESVLANDDAWLAASDRYSQHGLGHGLGDARERDFVVSAQSDLLGMPVEKLARWLTTALRTLGATGERLAFVECIPRADAEVWEQMRLIDPELCHDARFVAFDELWAHGLPARAGQTWLSTRYHPHLIAAARGASGISLVAHQGEYYRVKHASVGSDWPIVQVSQTSAEQMPSPGPGFSRAQADLRRNQILDLVDRLYPAGKLVPSVRRGLARLRRG